ncbi:MAG: ATP-binding protein [Phycisphaerae bacterium]
MTSTETKPWSMTADSDAPAAFEPLPAPAEPDQPGRSAEDSEGSGRMAGRELRINPRWAFIPLVSALACAPWGVVATSGGEVTTFQLVGLLISQLAAAGLLWFGLSSQGRQIDVILDDVHRVVGSPALRNRTESALASRDLAELQRALLSHLDRLEQAQRQSHDRGVELGHRLAKVETRHVQDVFNALGSAVVVVDAFDRMVLTNTAATSLFGFDGTQALRIAIDDVISDKDFTAAVRAAHRQPIGSPRRQEHVIGEHTYQLTTTRTQAGDGGGEASDAGAVEDGRSQQVIAVLTDITREKEAARRASEFVSHVAHELRTPLSSLKAYVEMLVDGEAQDEKTRREYYDIIQSETERTARMIDNILNISRIESGRIKAAKELTALAPIVRDVVDVMRPQAEQKGITLRDELAPVIHQVIADRDLMYEAVLNLVSNAIKYTPEGGRVVVRMQVDEAIRTVTTDVTDTGAGIPEADMPRMFEKFFRVPANAKLARGTGLGLNLVRRIVETVHDGKVSVRSQPGRGSTFSIVLPLA